MIHGLYGGKLTDKLLRAEARGIYRRLLRQGKIFSKIDPVIGSYVTWRTCTLFRRNEHTTSLSTRKQQLKTARKSVRLLGKAGAGDGQAMEKLIGYSYGSRGRVKHLIEYAATGRAELNDLPTELWPLVNHYRQHTEKSIALLEFVQHQLETAKGYKWARRQRRMYERALQMPDGSTSKKLNFMEVNVTIEQYFATNNVQSILPLVNAQLPTTEGEVI